MTSESNIPPALQEAFPNGNEAADILKIIQENGIENYTIEVNPGSTKGDNYIGCLYRINIKSPDRELRLILKGSKKSGMIAEFMPSNVVFKREIFMYETVLKRFEDFQSSKGINDPDQGFFNYAKIYSSSSEEGDEYLIFEDLLESQYQMHDRQKTLNVIYCELILRQLARYHACSFAFKDQAFEEYSELAKNLPELAMKTWADAVFGKQDDQMVKMMKEMGTVNMERALATLDTEKDQDVIAIVKDFLDIIEFEYFQFASLDKMEKYTIINHGDCWNNNFMFKSSDGDLSNPKDVRFVDWQMSCINSPAVDLGYFIYLCTDNELRNSHFDRLMDFYYENVCSHIKLLGSDPEKLFPYKAFKRSLRKYLRYGAMMALSMIQMMCGDADEIPDFDNMKSSEFDSKEKIMKNMNFEKSRNEHLYKERMSGVLRHAATNGFLD